MATRLRSSTGCWTCRLRRKKCDEAKPACQKCTKLQLVCEGYAQRPFWMDGGIREKLRAEQTKLQVRDRRGVSGGPTNFEQAISQPPTPFSDIQENSCLELVDASMTAYQQNFQDFTMPELRAAEISCCVDPNRPSTVEQLETLHFWPTDTHPTVAMHQGLDFRLPTYSIEYDVMNLFNPLPASPPRESEMQFFFDSAPGLEMSPCSRAPSSCSSTSSSSTPRPSLSIQPTLEEAALLLHYLDNMHVFQPPLCWLYATDRPWLYVLITRTKASYWATLSLSTFGLGQDESSFYELALQEINKDVPGIFAVSGKDCQNRSLDCCFSMLQLIFLEMLQGKSNACRMHISAASNMLADLQHDPDTSLVTSSSTTPQLDIFLMNSTAMRFISVSLRWCDAMISSLLRIAPVLSLEWPKIPEPSSKNTENDLLICYQYWQDRIVACISQIAALDAWKIEVIKADRLSVMELVKRATVIETQLNDLVGASKIRGKRGVAKLPLTDIMQTTASAKTMQWPTHMNQYIADIMVSAALVYLHVTVGGAKRRLSDIRNLVHATVELFRSLPSTQSLVYLTWPLCIAGCLAEGEDRMFLLDLTENASPEEASSSRRIEKTALILKECWRLADDGQITDPEWSSAISHYGYEIIIL